MCICPHPETISNPINGETEENPQYLAWHEGFEMHKLEMLMKMKCTEVYLRELIAEAKKISELKRELKTKSTVTELKSPVI